MTKWFSKLTQKNRTEKGAFLLLLMYPAGLCVRKWTGNLDNKSQLVFIVLKIGVEVQEDGRNKKKSHNASLGIRRVF